MLRYIETISLHFGISLKTLEKPEISMRSGQLSSTSQKQRDHEVK